MPGLRAALNISMTAVAVGAGLYASVCFSIPLVFSAGGDNTEASIQSTVDAFRAALGNPNNGNTAGPLSSGRREINWDGGESPTVNGTPPVTPFTVFQNTRGATVTTPGIGLTQAADTGGLLALDLINPTYADAFGTFSANRLFSPLSSNITDVTFSIPGTNGTIEASVGAFGAVFTDVDLMNLTLIEYFDPNGVSLFSGAVPAGTVADGSLSFFGALFTAGERIARVRITTGNTALGPTDNPARNVDVVVMDDFFYQEPTRLRVVPEPEVLSLLGIGFLGLALCNRCRRRA
jgi:hypothetical protein